MGKRIYEVEVSKTLYVYAEDAGGIEVEVHPAQWKRFGAKAGPVRNQAMISTRPDGLIAIRGGRGTDDVVRRAKHAGVPVLEVERATSQQDAEARDD